GRHRDAQANLGRPPRPESPPVRASAPRRAAYDRPMTVAYDPTEWHDLFVAVAGASAALLGLLFVAVSINLERILAYKGLPERALETLLLLLGVLLISIVGLMP